MMLTMFTYMQCHISLVCIYVFSELIINNWIVNMTLLAVNG